MVRQQQSIWGQQTEVGLLVLESRLATHVLGMPPGMVNRLDVTLMEGVDPDKVRRDLESVARRLVELAGGELPWAAGGAD